MSRLRRDRQAMKWARYARRNEKAAGHLGDVKESRRHWHHLGWLIQRKARAYKFGDDDAWFREAGHVIRLFHP